MHICFIIDNSPLTKQAYNYTNGTNCTNSNITILETIKISVQTMLNELNRSGILMRDYQTLHLFVTSNPHMPISSVDNGEQHFNYQLKEIKSSDTMTFPGETILFALKHISRFRILTETETLLGYREGLIYEPALIIFISYGLTMRKINQIQSANIHKQMRSEYKFAHFRLCYPSQLEKDKNIEKYKEQIESSVENRKFMELVQKLNRGQHRNVVKYAGKQCLTEMLVRLFTTYRPTLSCNLLFDSQNMNKIKMPLPQYWTNSELGSEIFMFASDNTTNLIKVELLVKNEQRNSNSGTVESSNRNLIPLPFEAVLKQEVNLYKIQYNIEQVSPIQFYIDISKKLSKNLNMCLPVISYVLANTSSKLAKLEKELQRLGINEIGFPVYSANISGQNKKQKQFYLLGFLHYSRSSKQTEKYYFSLVLSYPDFPMLDSIVSYIQTQRVDNRRLQKLLIEYHLRIPQFYDKFVGRYFKRQSTMKPIYNMYEVLSANNWGNANNISQPSSIRSNKFKQLQLKQHVVQNSRGEQKTLLEKQRSQNINKHTNHTAECCPIYNDPNIYKNYMRKTAKKWENKKSSLKQTSCEAVLSHLLTKVCEFNEKYGIRSYFGGSQAIKQSSMTRETDRYMQKSYTENERFGQMNKELQFAAPNQSANYSTMGLNASKKIKRSGVGSQQEEQMRVSREKVSQKNEDIFESIMGEQNEELLMSGSEIEEQMQYQVLEINQGSNYEIDYMNKIRQQIQSPNSISIQSLKGSQYVSEVSEIKEMERQLLTNKRNAQQSFVIKGQEGLSSMQDKIQQHNTIINRSSLEFSSERENKQSQKQRQKQYEILQKVSKRKMLQYINKISLSEQKIENKVKMSISAKACNIKEGKFEQNIIKLARVGLVKDLNQYINDIKQ